MTNPYRYIYELCKWLKANGSGVYRPSAHAATVIEEQESEITTLRDENDRIRAKLAAMDSQKCVAAKEFGGWDGLESLDEMPNGSRLYAKPVPADKPSHWAVMSPGRADQYRAESVAVRKELGFSEDSDEVAPIDLLNAIRQIRADRSRITEQDAREAARSYAFYCMSEARGDAGTLADWIGSPEGLALLNKLNSDRDQVPAVAVPDIVESVAAFVESQTGGEFTPKVIAAAIRGQLKHGDEFKDLCAPSPSHQNAVADSERYCDSHCTWRDHHHDCPSHESEQGGAV